MYVGKQMTCSSNLISESDFKPKALNDIFHPLISLSTYPSHSKPPRSVAFSAKATILVTRYGIVERIRQTWILMLLGALISQSWLWESFPLGFSCPLSFSCLLWKWGQEDLPGKVVRKVFGELSKASHIGAHRHLSSVPGAVSGSQSRKLINRVWVQGSGREITGLMPFFYHYPYWIPASVWRPG